MSRDVRVAVARFNTILTQDAAAALIAQTLVPAQPTAMKLLYAKRGADHDFVLVNPDKNAHYTIKHFTHNQTGQSVIRLKMSDDNLLAGDCDERLKPLSEATNAQQTNYLFPEGVGHGIMDETDAQPENVSYNTPEGERFIKEHSTPAYFDNLRAEMNKSISDNVNDTIMKQIERLGGTKFDVGNRVSQLVEEIASIVDQLVERNETRLLHERTRHERAQSDAEKEDIKPAPSPSMTP